MSMKTISVVVPCYNEEENVEAMALAIKETFRNDLPDYRYEIIFIDNDSTDQTRNIIRRLCGEDKNIKGIFNAKNFGQFNSPYYAMLQSTGDCTILMAADFQDPVEMIPKYVLEWEYGYKIVIGIKSSSRENKLMYWLRGCYYKMIKKLYDRDFIQVLRDLDDPTPFLRGIVAELGFRRKEISYQQPRRRAGKTSNNFYRLYDAAMLSITSYTKAGLRLATIFGSICSAVSILVAVVYLVMSRTGENGRKTGKGEPGAMKREPEDNKEDSGRGRQKETRQNEPQIKKQQQKEAPQKSTEAMKEEGAHTKRRRRRKKSEGSKLNAPKQEE